MSENKIEEHHTPEPPETHETTIIHAAPATSQASSNLVLVLALCVIALIGATVAIVLRNKDESEDAEKARIKEQIAALNGGGDMLANSSTLQAKLDSIIKNANSIQVDFDRMKSGYTDAKQQLASAKTELAGNLRTINRLSLDYSKMQQENAKLRSLAARAQSLQQQLNMLNQSLAQKDATIAKLNTRPSQEALEAARNSLNNERMTRQQLNDEIIRLKKRLITMVDASELEQYKRRLPELIKENERLLVVIQGLRTRIDFAKLFVKSDQLPAKAQALYAELLKLENATANELATAYRQFGIQLNAEVLMQVRFPVGSSIVSFKDQTTLKDKLSATQPGDYFLVVGYASTSGDAASNEKLSAQRATAVASIVNQLKAEGQDVRAVYLGQTARFSRTSQADNQLCEVWRIRK